MRKSTSIKSVRANLEDSFPRLSSCKINTQWLVKKIWTIHSLLMKKWQQTPCILSGETLYDKSVIRSILLKILKMVITGYWCIKVTCTCSHKIASL